MPSRRTCSAAILAGGRARRLGGRAKGALLVAGRSILSRQLDVLAALPVTAPVVVGGRAAPGLGPVVADAVPDAGALGALYTALVAAAADPVIVLAADLPFVTAPFLRHLLDAAGEADAAVPRTADGWHPLCGVYRRRAAGRLKARLDRAAWRVIDALADLEIREVGPEAVRAFDPDGVLLLNVNTPADYDRACRHADRQAPRQRST